MANFLKDLPCKNRENFQQLEHSANSMVPSGASRHSNSVKRPPVFIQTKDYPEEQVIITTEKTNMLLRYLQKEMDKKNRKREALKSDEADSSPKKQMKLSADS